MTGDTTHITGEAGFDSTNLWDIAGARLERDHVHRDGDSLTQVAVDGAVSGVQAAALRELKQESLAPVADAVSGFALFGVEIGAIGLKNGITALHKKLRSLKKPGLAEPVRDKNAEVKNIVRGVSLAKGELLPHKKRRARIKRALVIRAAADTIRSRGRDVVVGTGAVYGALKVAAVVPLLSNPVGIFLVGGALMVAGSVALQRAVRGTTGESGLLQPFTDNWIAMALGQRTLKEAGKDIARRYKAMGQHLHDYNLEKKSVAPAAQSTDSSAIPTAASPRRARVEKRRRDAGAPVVARPAGKAALGIIKKPRRQLAFTGAIG